MANISKLSYIKLMRILIHNFPINYEIKIKMPFNIYVSIHCFR